MNSSNRKYYVLNYIFIFGLIVLCLNDHVLKWEYSNWITGKLSDFVGLFIFPFFLSFIFPVKIKLNVILTGVFFIFWKSSYSQSFIDFYNSITIIEITRVVDYSDLIALSVLPISYYSINKVIQNKKLRIDKLRIHPLVILLPSVVVFMATSPPYWHSFLYADGNLKLYRTKVNVRMSQKEIINKLEMLNVYPVIDTAFTTHNPEILSFYSIDELILDNDTIRDLKFSMVSFKENKTKVFVNAMNISEDIKDADVKKELRKYYKKLLKKFIKGEIKK